MSESKSSGKPPLWLVFILISLLVTPPFMWLLLLLHAKPKDWGHIVKETFKRPLTYVWLAYACFAIWMIIKAYGT